MSGVYGIDIKESAEELKQMLIGQKVAGIKEKVQALYLLKTGYGQTVTKTAQILGRNPSTVQQWLQVYRSEGIEGLLQHKRSPGRPRAIANWAENALSRQLHQQAGFNDYQEIVEWLKQNCGEEGRLEKMSQPSSSRSLVRSK